MPRALPLFAFALTLSCAGPTDEELAEELWQSIDGFMSWNEPAGWEGIVPSSDGTHGPYVQIWIDDLTLNALDSGSEIPDGAKLVKCGYSDAEGNPVSDSLGHSLTAMWKIDGYDPDHGDWFWARFDGTTGEVATFAGQESACYSCHSADPDSDWVWYDDVEPGEE
jgi:hypothetical protein